MPCCRHRTVGYPIAMAMAEGQLDDLAAATGRDPAGLSAQDLLADDAYPHRPPHGLKYADRRIRPVMPG